MKNCMNRINRIYRIKDGSLLALGFNPANPVHPVN
jgi:hypothetical protein